LSLRSKTAPNPEKNKASISTRGRVPGQTRFCRQTRIVEQTEKLPHLQRSAVYSRDVAVDAAFAPVSVKNFLPRHGKMTVVVPGGDRRISIDQGVF
jgi:hypothetical protein